jgi:hypothetical protein
MGRDADRRGDLSEPADGVRRGEHVPRSDGVGHRHTVLDQRVEVVDHPFRSSTMSFIADTYAGQV